MHIAGGRILGARVLMLSGQEGGMKSQIVNRTVRLSKLRSLHLQKLKNTWKKPKAVVPRVHPHLRRDMFYLLWKVAVSNPLMIQNRNINQVRF